MNPDIDFALICNYAHNRDNSSRTLKYFTLSSTTVHDITTVSEVSTEAYNHVHYATFDFIGGETVKICLLNYDDCNPMNTMLQQCTGIQYVTMYCFTMMSYYYKVTTLNHMYISTLQSSYEGPGFKS